MSRAAAGVGRVGGGRLAAAAGRGLASLEYPQHPQHYVCHSFEYLSATNYPIQTTIKISATTSPEANATVLRMDKRRAPRGE